MENICDTKYMMFLLNTLGQTYNCGIGFTDYGMKWELTDINFRNLIIDGLG